MNYRKKYEQYLGIKLDLDVHVHHLDNNRSNNDLSNLVAIKNSIHRQYHKWEKEKESYQSLYIRGLNSYNFYLNNNGRPDQIQFFKNDKDTWYSYFEKSNEQYLIYLNEILSIKRLQDKKAQKLLVNY